MDAASLVYSAQTWLCSRLLQARQTRKAFPVHVSHATAWTPSYDNNIFLRHLAVPFYTYDLKRPPCRLTPADLSHIQDPGK